VVGRVEDMLRRFEPGAPPPAGARELLRELHDALAEGHPGEGGSRPISARPLGAPPPLGLNRLRMIDPRRRAARRRKRFATCATSSKHEPRTRSQGSGSWVIWALLFFAIVGYALSRLAPSSSVSPREGAFVGNAPHGPSRFQISFTVSGSAIRNSDIAWQAQCRSGKEWDDHALPAYSPISGWTGAQDYVTANLNGITKHVHVIADNGHFTTPT
jgi:hypothetical protein